MDDAARDARRTHHDPDQPGSEVHDRHRRGRRSDRAGDAAAAGRPRAGATVYTYDKATGARKVLREGTNQIECTPRNPDDGFTWCYNKVSGARRDFQAKLRAEGKSDKEIQEAVAAATKDGTLKPTPFGTMLYRLYGKKDRIQLLWVLSVPGAYARIDRCVGGQPA